MRYFLLHECWTMGYGRWLLHNRKTASVGFLGWTGSKVLFSRPGNQRNIRKGGRSFSVLTEVPACHGGSLKVDNFLKKEKVFRGVFIKSLFSRRIILQSDERRR